MTRAENSPLVLRRGEEVYDWAVQPRDSYAFGLLLFLREFSCCGARCVARA
jgi:hypothetical protein